MNLTEQQYEEMIKRFPGLESYLNRCLIQNEYRYLKDNEYILNDWQRNRLSELESYRVQKMGIFA